MFVKSVAQTFLQNTFKTQTWHHDMNVNKNTAKVLQFYNPFDFITDRRFHRFNKWCQTFSGMNLELWFHFLKTNNPHKKLTQCWLVTTLFWDLLTVRKTHNTTDIIREINLHYQPLPLRITDWGGDMTTAPSSDSRSQRTGLLPGLPKTKRTTTKTTSTTNCLFALSGRISCCSPTVKLHMKNLNMIQSKSLWSTTATKKKETTKLTITMLIFEMYVWSPAITC